MRAYKPTQLFGLIQNKDVTTMLFYGLTGPRGQRPITSRVPDDHIIDKHRTKIQGAVQAIEVLLCRNGFSAAC